MRTKESNRGKNLMPSFKRDGAEEEQKGRRLTRRSSGPAQPYPWISSCMGACLRGASSMLGAGR